MLGGIALFAGTLLAAADTTEYVVLNHGRHAGAMRVVADGDSTVVRFQYQDRQRGPQILTRYRFDGDGRLIAMAASGFSAAGVPQPVNERVTAVNGMVQWNSPPDSGQARLDHAVFFRLRNATPYDDALLARFLLRQPSHAASLLPFGSARTTIAADTLLVVNGASQRVRLALIEGVALSPIAVWLDDRDALFASEVSGWFITVRNGGVSVLPALRSIERSHAARRSEALARRLTSPASRPIVIRNGDVFDSERGVVIPHTSIVIEGERIVAVGPVDSIRAAWNAAVIDATGKTVIPGLWDMHTHLPGAMDEASSGLLQLAAGITTKRDLSSDIDLAVSNRSRAQAGTLLSPRLLLAGFIEGPGHWAGLTDALVRTEQEARAWVARYDSLGYRQIKLYNLIHPDLVPTIADETHRRGMRLSGHVPRGLSIRAAVQLGFDEINHAAFFFADFFSDSLFIPWMRAYSEVAAAVAPTFDVDGPEAAALISFLRGRGTVIDGTFNLYQTVAPRLQDGSHPVYGPTLAWLPPLVRRTTPQPPSDPRLAARVQRGSANYLRLLKRLFDGGITLVPGTDPVNVVGLAYHGELEIYERAGIPPAQVLQMATIIPARVMGEDREYGGIAPGKIADLVIVDGRPTEDIRALRRTERVVRGGRVYRAIDLYLAAGLTPPR